MENNQSFSVNEYAGFWRRFLATFVDGGIVALLLWGLAFSLGINPFAEAKTNFETVYQIISFIITIVFSILFWVNYNGATPGKKLLAIRVVHGEDAKRITYGVAIIRYVGYFVSFVPLGLGYFWVAFDSKKQSWHDKIAGTYVIKTDQKPRTGLAIFFTILVIIGSSIIGIIAGISQTPELKQAFEEGVKENNSNYRSFQSKEGDSEMILSYAPSNCGLSIPVPKTEDKEERNSRKWLYEELVVDKGLANRYFYLLDSNTFSPSIVLFSNVSYKTAEQLLGKKETSLAFPGLNIYCADNNKNLSLEEFKSLALLNKQLSVKEEGRFRWGELDVIGVFTQGTLSDGLQLKEPGYIGVTKDNKKLLYLRIWQPDLKDLITDRLQADVELIVRNLKHR